MAMYLGWFTTLIIVLVTGFAFGLPGMLVLAAMTIAFHIIFRLVKGYWFEFH